MRELGGVLPRVSTFQHYAAVLAERGEFERAVHVCEAAIAFGLHDGTKGGYEGRIERIKKKAEGKSGERKKASNARFSPAMEPVASSMVALQRPDSFSEPHRQRTRPIQAAVFPLDDIPFRSASSRAASMGRARGSSRAKTKKRRPRSYSKSSATRDGTSARPRSSPCLNAQIPHIGGTFVLSPEPSWWPIAARWRATKMLRRLL